MRLRSGASVVFIDADNSSAASRTRNVSAVPLRMRWPAARAIPRANEIPRPRVRQCLANVQAALHLVLAGRTAMRRMVGPVLTGFGQGRHVAAVSFDPPTAGAVHRRGVPIRDDDLTPFVLPLLRGPLPPFRGLPPQA